MYSSHKNAFSFQLNQQTTQAIAERLNDVIVEASPLLGAHTPALTGGQPDDASTATQAPHWHTVVLYTGVVHAYHMISTTHIGPWTLNLNLKPPIQCL